MSLVCWSGGCDSTLALFDLCKDATERKPVRVVSVRHDQVGAATEQAKARRKILAELRKRGYHIQAAEVSMKTRGQFRASGGGPGPVQPILWLAAVLPFLGVVKREDLVLGYIKEDCIWHYKSHLQHAFDYICEMLGRSHSKLVLPFEWIPKTEIIARLRKAGLYKLTFSCERPQKGKPCGVCPCCQERRTAEWQLRTFKRELLT